MESARESTRNRAFVSDGARCGAVAIYAIGPSAQRNQMGGGEISMMLTLIEFDGAAQDRFQIASADACSTYGTRELATRNETHSVTFLIT